jgi:hypothetical protein
MFIIREKPAISAAAGIIRSTGPLASEFLEAVKLDGANVAANRIAREHYLRAALNAWVALKAARGRRIRPFWKFTIKLLRTISSS